MLLLALAIVGFLAKDAILHYALSGTSAVRSSAPAAESARGTESRDASRDSEGIRRAPTPIERARGVEDIVKRGAEERARTMP